MSTTADEAWKKKWEDGGGARDANRRKAKDAKTVSRGAIVFVAVNLVLLALALAVRLATPQIVLSPLAHLRPASISVTNICQNIDSHLLNIARTPTEPDILQFNSRIVNFDNYLTRVMLRLPEFSQGYYDMDFLTSLHALKRLTFGWTSSDTTHPLAEAADLKAKLIAFRPHFRIETRRIVRPAPLWYLHIARFSMGLTEGMLAPICIGWRAAECLFMPSRVDVKGLAGSGRGNRGHDASLKRWASGGHVMGSLKADYIFAPNDWRRDGPLFALAALYGAFAGWFLLAFAGQRLRWSFLAVIGFAVALYGLVSFATFCARYNKQFDAWFTRKTDSFYSLFDFLLPPQK